MNSFYGGVPGASFVIVKRFDCIDINNLPEDKRDQVKKFSWYACDNENNIYVYAHQDKDGVTRYYPIVRNEVNKYYYEYWYGHRDDGTIIPMLREQDPSRTDDSFSDLNDNFYTNAYRYASIITPIEGSGETNIENPYDKYINPNAYYNYICQTFKPTLEGSVKMVVVGSRWYRWKEEEPIDEPESKIWKVTYYKHYDTNESKCITDFVKFTAAEYAEYIQMKDYVAATPAEAEDFTETNIPKFKNQTIEGMVQCFERGGETNAEVGFGEYVIIDSSEYTGWIDNPDNGKIFRRGLNYNKSNTNPLAGAEYVGRILGPQGEAIPTIVTSLDDVHIDGLKAIDGQKKTYRIGNYALDSNNVYPYGGVVDSYAAADGQPNRYFRVRHTQNEGSTDVYYDWRFQNQTYEESTDGSKAIIITQENSKMNFLYEGFFNKPIFCTDSNILYRMYIENAQDDDTPYSDLLPGMYYKGAGDKGYNDEIHYGWVTLRDAHTNKIVGTKLGFKFPYHVFTFNAESVSPYYERDDYDYSTGDFEPVANFNNRNVLTRVDDGKHPFYQSYQFHIPKGKHGKDVVEVFSQLEKTLNLRTNQLRIETVNKLIIEDYLSVEQDPKGYSGTDYIFAKNNRQWYRRENDVFVRWNVNKYEDDLHSRSDLATNNFYADYEYPYNLYKVYSGKGLTNITNITGYKSQFMEDEDNHSILTSARVFNDSNILYNITDISINNYIEFEVIENGVRTPYWCHYDEKIVDNAYPDECIYSKYINYERFADGETDVIYFGPIVEYKEVTLEPNGLLNIYFAHRDDTIDKQLYWINRSESKDQRDLLFYYCDDNKTLASEQPNAIQKLDYFYIENYKFEDSKRPNIKYWKTIVSENIIEINSGESDIFKNLQYDCIYYVSAPITPPLAADGNRHNVNGSNQYAVGFYRKDDEWFNQLKPMIDDDSIDHYAKYAITNNQLSWYKKTGTNIQNIWSETAIVYSSEDDYKSGDDTNAHNKYLNIDTLFYKNQFNPTKEGYINKTQVNYGTVNEKDSSDKTSYKFVSIDYKYQADDFRPEILNKEGEGDQRIHYSLNNEQGDQSIGLPINYIMESAITTTPFYDVETLPTGYEYQLIEAYYRIYNNSANTVSLSYYDNPNRQKERPSTGEPVSIDATKWVTKTYTQGSIEFPKLHHLYVLNSDPARRGTSPILYSKRFHEFRTDWEDLGYCNNRIDPAKIAGYIDNIDLFQNNQPPEILFNNTDYRGWCALHNNAIWGYDYEKSCWYEIEKFNNTLNAMRAVWIDNKHGSDENNDGSYSYPYKTIERGLKTQFCDTLKVYLKGDIDRANTYGYDIIPWQEVTMTWDDFETQAVEGKMYHVQYKEGDNPQSIIKTDEWKIKLSGIITDVTNYVNKPNELPKPEVSLVDNYYLIDGKMYKCISGKTPQDPGEEKYILDYYENDGYTYKNVEFYNYYDDGFDFTNNKFNNIKITIDSDILTLTNNKINAHSIDIISSVITSTSNEFNTHIINYVIGTNTFNNDTLNSLDINIVTDDVLNLNNAKYKSNNIEITTSDYINIGSINNTNDINCSNFIINSTAPLPGEGTADKDVISYTNINAANIVLHNLKILELNNNIFNSNIITITNNPNTINTIINFANDNKINSTSCALLYETINFTAENINVKNDINVQHISFDAVNVESQYTDFEGSHLYFNTVTNHISKNDIYKTLVIHYDSNVNPIYVNNIFNDILFSFNTELSNSLFTYNTQYNSCILNHKNLTIQGSYDVGDIAETDISTLLNLNNCKFTVLDIGIINNLYNNSTTKIALPIRIDTGSSFSCINEVKFHAAESVLSSSVTKFIVRGSSYLYIANNLLLPSNKIDYIDLSEANGQSSYIFTGRSKRMIQSLTQQEYNTLVDNNPGGLDPNMTYIITYSIEPPIPVPPTEPVTNTEENQEP